ncbi:synaptotagmin 1-like isoform X1 [Xenia sp. Carnegie-2017]|uniref:synaptotagmin 1-like isoform X1 n=1 Tax=Xenia sp. Carnegie-2017 TaxID=2897299 RepID=UPI001F04C37F|nr:synaptotagmin 1-like isoform X1 [Xenia sp. Carnegie-2017]
MSRIETSEKGLLKDFKETSSFPLWIAGVFAGLTAILFLLCLVFVYKKFCHNGRKAEKNYENDEVLDLKSVQLVKASYHEKVQPSMDELDYNSEGFESGTDSEVTIGRIHFKLAYDFTGNTLSVNIIEAENVPAKDLGGYSDPYIRVMILPDKRKKFETKVQKRTLDPVYNETFVFKNIPYSDIENRTLLMEVYDFDRFSGHDIIGIVKLPLIDVDLTHVVEDWRILIPPSNNGWRKKTSPEIGEICFAIRYVPANGKLQINILEGKNLKSTDKDGYSDPYIKISLVQDGKKVQKRKTTVKKHTLNPYYNETFTFNVPFEKIEFTSLMVVVLDYDRLSKSEVIGRTIIGALAPGGPELQHWQDMLASPRKPVAQWHALSK